MKCPKCQAKLLPVDGEMFCLQCGTAVAMPRGADASAPNLEETTDPLLQKAILDVVRKPVKFSLPVSQAPPAEPKTTSFSSMRAILAPPRAVLMQGGAAAASGAGVMAPRPAPTPAVPVKPAQVARAPEFANGLITEPDVQAKLPPAADIPQKRGRLSVGWHAPSVAWVAGIAVFGSFLLANGAVFGFYSDKVYPGVRIGDTQLGGLPLEVLREKLAAMAAPSKLTVEVGAAKYELDMAGAGKVDLDRVEREVRSIGHSTTLPIAGAVQSLTSQPVTISYSLDEAAVKGLAQDLARKLSHKPSDAVPMVVGGQAFVVAEKAGSEISVERVVAAIKDAYGSKQAFKLSPDKLTPLVAASAYSGDLQEAQNRLSLGLQVKVRTATHVPSAAQIGGWLVFNGPGKGVAVNGAAVAAYVDSLPGRFDRAGTTNALIAAVQAKQSLTYTASTRRTSVPSLANLAAAWPVRSFSYCTQSPEGEASAFGSKAAAVMGDGLGWALGGRLRFAKAGSDCNFTLQLVEPAAMSSVDPGCAGRTTCQAGNVLAISLDSWKAAPEGWKGGLEAYRAEMIGHEVGHWLGFEHASCTTKPTASPVLASPTVVLGGCSPNWYALPAESLGSKILPAF